MPRDNGAVIHDDRRRAGSFGEAAEQYERARPTYPDELVDALMADRPLQVLDVGCGTGKAGRLFAARGCEVLGVEPTTSAVFGAVYEREAPELRQSYALGTLPAEESELRAVRNSGCFDPVEIVEFHWERRYTRDEWLDQLPTHSDHRVLPERQRGALLKAVGEAIDGFGGSVLVHYRTKLISGIRAR